MTEKAKRFWVRWRGGANGDPRPLTFPVPVEWWCSGSAEGTGANCIICAIVDAAAEDAAKAEVLKHWPEAIFSFAEEKPVDWRPPADRFPPKEKSIG